MEKPNEILALCDILNSTALCMNHFHRKLFCHSIFLLDTRNQGRRQNSTHCLHQPWCMYPAHTPALGSGSYSLTSILVSFPGTGRRQFTWHVWTILVSLWRTQVSILWYSIYWSCNLTLNWKAYFSNFSIILAAFRAALKTGQVCLNFLTMRNYDAFILSLWLVCCLGHPFQSRTCVHQGISVVLEKIEQLCLERYLALRLWKIWCKIPELTIHPSSVPSGYYLAFFTSFQVGMAWNASIFVSYENGSSRWTNRVAPD